MDCAVLELEMAQNKWFVMTQRAPQLRRSRWRLAILVLRGVDEKSAKRIKIKLRSLSLPRSDSYAPLCLAHRYIKLV